MEGKLGTLCKWFCKYLGLMIPFISSLHMPSGLSFFTCTGKCWDGFHASVARTFKKLHFQSCLKMFMHNRENQTPSHLIFKGKAFGHNHAGSFLLKKNYQKVVDICIKLKQFFIPAALSGKQGHGWCSVRRQQREWTGKVHQASVSFGACWFQQSPAEGAVTSHSCCPTPSREFRELWLCDAN